MNMQPDSTAAGGTSPADDLSALAWVHGELRRSLETAHKALRRYLKEADAIGRSDVDAVDPAVLRGARVQLHQGVGALELVGLPGAAQVLRASEAAVQRWVAKPGMVDAGGVETIERCSFALLDFLGRLLAGKPLSPIALFPQYRAVQTLAGADRIHPADLWAHDWQWRPMPRDRSAAPRRADDATRSEMESLVLQLMRQPDAAGATRMSELCAGLASGVPAAGLATGNTGSANGERLATLWQLAAAFFEAQAAGLLASDVYSKRIASRLLAQLRMSTKGRDDLSDRLAHDLLFFCAHAAVPADPAAAPRLAAVRRAWQPDDSAAADYETPRLGRFDPAWISQARKRIAGAKEAWSAVAGGEMHRLGSLAEQFSLLGDSVQRLFPAGEKLAQALQSAATQTVASACAPPPALAMEVATCVLCLEASIDDGELDAPELGPRVQRLVQRINDVRIGVDAEALEPWMEDLYRRVSDRQTMGSVVQELRASLSEVEKQIDQYFRNPAQRDVLIPVPGQLSAMRGVFSVLGVEQASLAVLHMRDDVAALAETEVDPQRAVQTGTFDRLADNLGALSFLIDMLAVQPQLAKSLFRFDPETGNLSAVMGQSERPSAFATFDEAPADDSLPLLDQAQSLAAAAAESDVSDTEFGRQLERISQQAVAAEQSSLARMMGSAQSALRRANDEDTRQAVRAELVSAMANFAPMPAAAEPPRAPVPPASPLPVPVGDTGLEDDPELRDIFIEEAREVVAAAGVSLARLSDHPEDAGEMTALRRAFHTLKGSSRMVGLGDFGNAAWACEQLFNARIAKEPRLDPALRQFTGEALGYLGSWAEAIAAGRDDGHAWPDVALSADALRLEDRRLPIPMPGALAQTEAPAQALAEPEPTAPGMAAASDATLVARVPDLPSAADLDLGGDWLAAPDALDYHAEPQLPDGWADEVSTPLPEVAADSIPAAEPGVEPELSFELDLGAFGDPPAAEPLTLPEFSPDFGLPSLPEPSLPDEWPAALPEPTTEVIDLDFGELTAAFAELSPPTAEPAPADVAEFDLVLTEPEPEPEPEPELVVSPEPQKADDEPVFELPEQPFELAGDEIFAAPVGPLADLPAAPEVEPAPDAAVTVTATDFDFGFDLDAAEAASAQAPQPAEGETSLQPLEDEEPVRLIGGLRIGIPLFNIYLNEADELSRRLGVELAEWGIEHHHRAVPETAVALAHSLAGSSATVGYADLSSLARALEHALMRSQLAGHGRPGEAELFNEVGDEVRRLLHQFAAGFLRPVAPELLDRLAEHERLPVEVASEPVEPEAGPEPAAEPAVVAEMEAEVEAEPRPDFGVPTLSPGLPFLAVNAAATFAPLAEAGAEPLRAMQARADAFDDEEDIDAVDSIDTELFPIFEEEAAELLPQLQSRLRDWAERPANLDAASACMRTLHTFKGGARLAGAMRLGEMAHRLETAIEHLAAADRVGEADVEPLLGRVDSMSAAFELLRHPAEVPPAALPATPVAPVVPSPLGAPAGVVEVEGAAVEEVVDEVAEAEAVEIDTAEADVIEPVEPEAVASAAAEAPALVQPLPLPAVPRIDWRRFRTDSAAAAPVAERQAATGGAVRVRAALLDRLVNQAGEVSITRARIDADVRQLQGSLVELTDSLDRMRRQLRDIEVQADTQISSRLEAAKAAALTFDPLEMDRYTRFQELTRFMAESVNDVATLQRSLQRTLQSTEDELAAQARLTRGLQDDLLRTRMVEFESLADRLYRTVRQAAKDTGKTVRLDIVGGAIEVDRGVLERMVGPFEHLLRNCVAHGVEPPDARVAAGKERSGTVTLSVSHEGNEVGVEVRDDGGGLDLERIRARGVERGLLGTDVWTSDADLAKLIFKPGFSTAATVTELSGRGVGLDVVMAEVNAMGGRIETASTPGQGTRFRLLLPLTTAVTQVVMLRCGSLSVAVPSTLIEVVKRVPTDEVERAYASGGFTSGDQVLPFYWLAALLQAGARGATSGRTQSVVVVRSASQRVALHVDEVLGNQEVVVKNLGPQLSRLPGLAGVTLLPSGLVALIYNPVALATLYGEPAHARLRLEATAVGPAGASGAGDAAPEAAAPVLAPLVLVVDDSLTVRRVTQRLLLREGYRVTLAKDGMDALERLAEERPAVMLSDIEMPRMDGFDLVRNVRADPSLADLPVIMITSRIAQKHREYAGQLGVDHYLGKPFAEDELLSLVARYVGADIPT